MDLQRLARLPDLIRETEPLALLAELAGPGRVYLVGGAVRDLLLGRDRRGDIDLAVGGDVFPLCRDLAQRTGAVMVILSQEERTVRLVFPQLEMDLAGFRRDSLEGDLRARDFSLNALAVDLHRAAQGEIDLIDPCQGLRDLEEGVLRVAGPDSLPDDPLRILRAYRFGAELGFSLAPELERAISSRARELGRVAGERIAAEIIRLLQTPASAAWLDLMHCHGVLGALFPEVSALEGLAQNRFHHLDGLAHTLEAIRRAEEFLAGPGPDWIGEIASDPDRLPVVKLALLFHDAGKRETRAEKPDGGLSFHGHEKVSARLWALAAGRLKLSRRLTRTVEMLILAHMRPLSLLTAPEPTLRAKRRLILTAGDHLGELGLLCLADSLASQGPEKDPGFEERLTALWEDLLALRSAREVQTRAPLLSGKDLIRELGLSPGPLIGRLLAGLEEARLGGEIENRQGALEWARRKVEEDPDHPAP